MQNLSQVPQFFRSCKPKKSRQKNQARQSMSQKLGKNYQSQTENSITKVYQNDSEEYSARIDDEIMKCQLELEEIERQEREKALKTKMSSEESEEDRSESKRDIILNEQKLLVLNQNNDKINQETHKGQIIDETKTSIDSLKQSANSVKRQEERTHKGREDIPSHQNQPSVNIQVTTQNQNIILQGQHQIPNNPNAPKQQINNHNHGPSDHLSRPKELNTSKQLNFQKQEINNSMESKDTIKMTQSFPVQELRQELVHHVTDNLEKIFEIFKNQLPDHDEIEIIRALYIKYIGPEQPSKPKPKPKPKTIPGPPKPQRIPLNQHPQIQKASNSQNSSIKPKTLPANRFSQIAQTILMEQKQQHQMGQRLNSSPPMSKPAIQTVQKRAYTKRGGQGNQRFFDQQKVAKLFIKKGYGLHIARKYLQNNQSNNHYTNIITTIIRETWRKIQDQMARFKRIKPMNTNQFKVIKTQLVNCSKWMDPGDLDTFYGFMKICYQLDNKIPYDEDMIRLYNTCIKKYEELRGPYEAQMQLKMEKKMIKSRGGSDAGSEKSAKFENKVVPNRIPRSQDRRAPSDRELEDLTSLIKSQMKHPYLQQQPKQYIPPPPQHTNFPQRPMQPYIPQPQIPQQPFRAPPYRPNQLYNPNGMNRF